MYGFLKDFVWNSLLPKSIPKLKSQIITAQSEHVQKDMARIDSLMGHFQSNEGQLHPTFIEKKY